MAPRTLVTEPSETLAVDLVGERGLGVGLSLSPWVLALAVSAPLAVSYLVLDLPSGDLAAATYRGDLFARFGFTLWDSGWYGGHYLPGYSLLAPALGALMGERVLLALCAIVSAVLFGLIAQRAFRGTAARAAGASFALGVCVGLLSGRVAYGLGIAIGLLALLALIRGWTAAALVFAVLTSLASPVAGAFLALAGLAHALAYARHTHEQSGGRGSLRLGASWRPCRLGLAFAAAALAPVLLFAVFFPEGGWELFEPLLFWPVLVGVLLVALVFWRAGGGLAPRTQRTLTLGTLLYALALTGAFLLRTPVGSNAARLGELLAAPLMVGVFWERRRLALALLAPALLYWQLEAPINDFAALANNPSVNASYYAPLSAELLRLADGRPLRVEVPLTEAHWESVYLPEHPLIMLARGWERQLDTRYDALFYGSKLSASAYRTWLGQNAVSYVALPDVPLDSAGEQEGRLIANGLPYLLEVWHSKHWRLFAVRDATALAQPPAVLIRIGPESFTLRTPRPGDFTVRLHFTPYWAVQQGSGSVGIARGGWTEVRARRAGVLSVAIGG